LANGAGLGISRAMAKITAREAIPLYHQIFLALRDEILSGARGFGSAMPTEQELGAAYGVSRITARRALADLAEQGLVERRRRIGTHVAFRAPCLPIDGQIDSAVESLIAFGRGTRVQVIEMGVVEASASVATQLALEPGTPVLRAVRLRSSADGPLGVIESFVPTSLGAALTRTSLTAQPILELIRSAGHIIGAGSQVISALPADPALAALLQTDARAAILRR